MATFKYVMPDPERSDGKYRIKIRVTHKRQVAYIATPFYIDANNIDSDGKIIDNVLVKELVDRIVSFEAKTVSAGSRLESMNVKELIAFLTQPVRQEEINLIVYFKEKIEGFRLTKKKKTCDGYRTAVNRLQRFHGPILSPEELTVRKLNDFEIDMRKNEGIQKKLASSTAISLYMTYLRTLCKIAEQEDVIAINPFRKGYKKPKADMPEKRSLKVEILRKILNDVPSDKLEILAHDVFTMSFALAGMNTADMYHCPNGVEGYIIYNREKTNRRKDKAHTEMRIPVEIIALVERYADKNRQFDFYKRYSNSNQFNKRINDGLSTICTRLEIDKITTYYARHSFSTIARNKCNIRVEDIDRALIHKNASIMTDVYTEIDYSIVDRAIRTVLDYVYTKKGGMKVVKMKVVKS